MELAGLVHLLAGSRVCLNVKISIDFNHLNVLTTDHSTNILQERKYKVAENTAKTCSTFWFVIFQINLVI